jgi:hypothetical protein
MTATELVQLLAAAAAVLTAAAALIHSLNTRNRVQTALNLHTKQQTEPDTGSSERSKLDPPPSVMKTMEERGLHSAGWHPSSSRWPGNR